MTNNPAAQQSKVSEYRYEDEISLIDLALVLMRHWVLIVVVAIVCVAMGLLYVINKPVLYEYTSTIEIGSFLKESELNGMEQVLLEEPEVLLSKLNESYIPLVSGKFRPSPSGAGKAPEIQAKLIKHSQLIRLASQGLSDDAKLHIKLHQAVVERAQKEQRDILVLMNQETEILRQEIKSELAELKDGMGIIQARQKRMTELSALLSRQAEQARSDLRLARENQQRVSREIKDGSRSLMALLLDAEVFRQSERLANIEERLKIELPDSIDGLNKDLADNLRAQELHRSQLEKIDQRLNGPGQFMVLTPAVRSEKPVSAQMKLVIGLSLVLGLVLGVFAAFFAEYLPKLRAQLRKAADTQ